MHTAVHSACHLHVQRASCSARRGAVVLRACGAGLRTAVAAPLAPPVALRDPREHASKRTHQVVTVLASLRPPVADCTLPAETQSTNRGNLRARPRTYGSVIPVIQHDPVTAIARMRQLV